MTLEWLAAVLGSIVAAVIITAAWLTGSRCPHCGRTAESHVLATSRRS
jgi:hypothetical protein